MIPPVSSASRRKARAAALVVTLLITSLTAPAPDALAKPKFTARQVVRLLAKAGVAVESQVDYTEKTDQNHLLGRPGGYTSKTNFVLASVPTEERHGGGEVSDGGSVEVYPDSSGAKRRAKYIKSVSEMFPMVGVEYQYVEGSTLLRISSVVTPSEARKIEKVFRSIV